MKNLVTVSTIASLTATLALGPRAWAQPAPAPTSPAAATGSGVLPYG